MMEWKSEAELFVGIIHCVSHESLKVICSSYCEETRKTSITETASFAIEHDAYLFPKGLSLQRNTADPRS